MKQRVLFVLSIFLLYSTISYAKSCDTQTCCLTPARTGIHYRSQGDNLARQIVGWQTEIHKPEMCELYGAGYLAFEYTRSFNPCGIARALFGTNKLKFAGSLVHNRKPDELVADNFGLAPTFKGTLKVCPRIENFIVDFGLYLGFDEWAPNVYLKVIAPVVHTRWSLGACGDCKRQRPCFDGDPFPPCYVDSSNVSTTNNSPSNFTLVNSAATIQEALSGNFAFGDMDTPWRSGKFDFCRRTRNGISNIDLYLGYDFISNDCSHLGGFIKAVSPTGRKQRSEFIFDPVVGNGGFFELGGGISAHSILWAGEDYNLALYLEGYVTHMFRSRQCRLFDFNRNGFFSRYLLLKEFDTDGTNLTYNGNLVSATEFATRAVDVRISVKGEAAVKLAYRWCGFGLDLGYDIYGHSHEKIRLRCDTDCDLNIRRFGVKGTTGVCCQNWTVANIDGVPTVFLPETAFPEAAEAPTGCPALPQIAMETTQLNNTTQPNATAFTVQPNTPVQIPNNACSVCLFFDDRTAFDAAVMGNPEFANGIPLSRLQALPGVRVSNTNRPTLIQEAPAALNLRSAEAPSYLTHKLFAHFNYMWANECGWNPHIGIGGEVEFTGKLKNQCNRFGVEQWGVWVKGGISF